MNYAKIFIALCCVNFATASERPANDASSNTCSTCANERPCSYEQFQCEIQQKKAIQKQEYETAVAQKVAMLRGLLSAQRLNTPLTLAQQWEANDYAQRFRGWTPKPCSELFYLERLKVETDLTPEESARFKALSSNTTTEQKN